MNQQKILFHGSRFKINNYLEPRKADDKNSQINSKQAIYATDRIECALGMSLTGEQWAFANYNDKDFKVIFVEEQPTPKIARYIYEISGDDFEEQPKGSHQWISFKKVRILKTHIYSTEDLKKYWRMATDDEKKERYELHNK